MNLCSGPVRNSNNFEKAAIEFSNRQCYDVPNDSGLDKLKIMKRNDENEL